jgi:hypothetical protein
MRSFITWSLHQMGDQIKEDEMGGACSMYGKVEKWVQNFDQKT